MKDVKERPGEVGELEVISLVDGKVESLRRTSVTQSRLMVAERAVV
jgi:hypothetical protein